MPDFAAFAAQVRADLARIARDEDAARMRLASLAVQRQEAEAMLTMLEAELTRSTRQEKNRCRDTRSTTPTRRA